MAVFLRLVTTWHKSQNTAEENNIDIPQITLRQAGVRSDSLCMLPCCNHIYEIARTVLILCYCWSCIWPNPSTWQWNKRGFQGLKLSKWPSCKSFQNEKKKKKKGYLFSHTGTDVKTSKRFVYTLGIRKCLMVFLGAKHEIQSLYR